MRTSGLRAGLAAAAGLALGVCCLPGTLRASDPPHWASKGVSNTTGAIDINCTSNCHTTHQSPAAQLSSVAGNANLCQSCHNAAGVASGLPLSNSDKAIPGTAGTSHGFTVNATNPAYGATPPADAQMALRVTGGQIACSTCHNQHFAQASFGGTPSVRPTRKTTTAGSTGSVASGGTFSGAAGFWYVVEVVAAGTDSTARFRYSKDSGTSWFPTNCSAGNLAPCLTASNVSVALDSGVVLKFTNGAGPTQFALNERWEFSASWPMLRAAMDNGDNAAGSRFCRDCHSTWTMDHTAAETYTGALRSHPVGVALNANARGYDRSTPLDGNGAVQGGGGADANPSNDYKLDAGGRVQCLSCHGVHYAPSNTSAVIP